MKIKVFLLGPVFPDSVNDTDEYLKSQSYLKSKGISFSSPETIWKESNYVSRDIILKEQLFRKMIYALMDADVVVLIPGHSRDFYGDYLHKLAVILNTQILQNANLSEIIEIKNKKKSLAAWRG